MSEEYTIIIWLHNKNRHDKNITLDNKINKSIFIIKEKKINETNFFKKSIKIKQVPISEVITYKNTITKLNENYKFIDSQIDDIDKKIILKYELESINYPLEFHFHNSVSENEIEKHNKLIENPLKIVKKKDMSIPINVKIVKNNTNQIKQYLLNKSIIKNNKITLNNMNKNYYFFDLRFVENTIILNYTEEIRKKYKLEIYFIQKINENNKSNNKSNNTIYSIIQPIDMEKDELYISEKILKNNTIENIKKYITENSKYKDSIEHILMGNKKRQNNNYTFISFEVNTLQKIIRINYIYELDIKKLSEKIKERFKSIIL
jgi:hypothetical protein